MHRVGGEGGVGAWEPGTYLACSSCGSSPGHLADQQEAAKLFEPIHQPIADGSWEKGSRQPKVVTLDVQRARLVPLRRYPHVCSACPMRPCRRGSLGQGLGTWDEEKRWSEDMEGKDGDSNALVQKGPEAEVGGSVRACLPCR